jgi:hypothetical protein
VKGWGNSFMNPYPKIWVASRALVTANDR